MQNLMRKQNKIPNNYKISIVAGVNIYMTRLKFVTMVMKNATHNLHHQRNENLITMVIRYSTFEYRLLIVVDVKGIICENQCCRFQ